MFNRGGFCNYLQINALQVRDITADTDQVDPEHGLMYYNADGNGLRTCNLAAPTVPYSEPPRLYALWEAAPITITLDKNAEDATAPDPGSVNALVDQPMPPLAQSQLPTRSGFMFAGYWSEQTGGTLYYNPDGTSAKDYPETDGPTTLYAHWLEGFELIEKLNFDGTHYILTDYVPVSNTWIETVLQTMGGNVSGGSASLFGLTEKVSSEETMSFGMNLSGTTKNVYGWVMGSEVNGRSQQYGKVWYCVPSQYILSYKSAVKFGNFGFVVTNVTSSQGYEGTERMDKKWLMDNRFPCHSTMAIGGYNGSLPAGASEKKPGYGTSVSPYSFTDKGLDVYSFKIYESANGDPADAEQTLKHNFIPVTNTVDEVAGLYDVINEVFYPLKTQTIVTLNANGGNQPTNYVYATAGEAMPSPIDVPTRSGYTFQGYGAKIWEARLMTGADTDICNEGTKVFAKMGCSCFNYGNEINGVVFDKSWDGSDFDQMELGGSGTWSRSESDYTTHGFTTAYASLMMGGIWRSGETTPITLKGLTVGHAYLFQFVVHEGRDESRFKGLRTRQVSVDNANWYQFGLHPSQEAGPMRGEYGVTFIYRFVATETTETFNVYFQKGDGETVSEQFNAVQLRDITDSTEGSNYYYDEFGKCLQQYPVSGGPAELYALWKSDKYHVINPETGPEIAVDISWLTGAFGDKDKAGYQAALFRTNDQGVVAWQTYILGYGSGLWESAAIVEESVQTADADKVRIQLRDMPPSPRTNETTRLSYSLLSATTPDDLANGGGTPVGEELDTPTFDAPLSDLDENPVNYYRIKLRFTIEE